ncbi:uncharacterized protein MELLADRAFT_87264 [Melampsora larici-populina 98AG31]|uniref:Uncharacterized protein n=1 Tax=Melampsora larici-populina (strain 98AG31 / pathotype 3-4-7) TaxID=747676 RepID=F4SDT0_MELLP|nr:uncharacterized protein MELLADRAFT_87264 [Melampsora larici-populina 98AG31]EGF97194.1 hypothetical protein MELLADRAFT_87264 [Melampsora larici-populina 98AG31]
MSNNKRLRQACTGINGGGPHLGKAKHANRQCTWHVCPVCCCTQREATGAKCYTHESGECAKVTPSTQPFLQTVLDTADERGLITQETTNGDSAIADVTVADLLGPAPPVHPLVISSTAMCTYHLNRSKEDKARRATEAAEASCDRNISISLWMTAESEPIPFLFAPKSIKQYSISECEALMIFLQAQDPNWNKLLRVYDVKADRWNITLVGTSIPMTTPLREALVCLTNVDPKMCLGMAELQVRLVPAARTSLKSVVDSLRATPTPNSKRVSTSFVLSPSSHKSATMYSSSESSPTPQITYLGSIQRPGAGQMSSCYGKRQPPPTVIIHDEEATTLEPLPHTPEPLPHKEARRPNFSRNILNDISSSVPPCITHPTQTAQANALYDYMSDLPDIDEVFSNAQSTNQINSISTPNPDFNITEGATTEVPSPAAIPAGLTPSPSPSPQPAATAEVVASTSTRRSKNTGLWPPPDMPMRKMTQWHLAHTTKSGKREIWESFFSPAYKWDRTAMYRYIQWINKVSKDRWADWYEECEREQVEATSEAARKTFASELEAAG